MPPQVRKIAFRYHLYWAGADQDGAVTGFYWAVVETLPFPPEGTEGLPLLPGPRASDYHYTSRTDSTFAFTVSEFSTDRQHAFYIYAVDDKGKPDPTPAKFVFFAMDRFPPLPTLDVSTAKGPVVRVTAPGVPTVAETTVTIKDTLNIDRRGLPPRDTVPSGSRIDFSWHDVPTLDRNPAVRYKYKMEEPLFVEVDTSVHSVSYGTGVNGDLVAPGTKLFTLRAIDEAGGKRDVTRFFQVNHNPDTWFAGPDSNLVPIVPNSGRQRYLLVPNWHAPPAFPGTSLSCDSLFLWPSERPLSKTFWEIYRDRLYLHVEDDTVNMNGWVVFSNGGTDSDSPYDVKVSTNDPIPDTATCASGQIPRVIRPNGPVGSPIGFRFQYAQRLDPGLQSVNSPSPIGLYPVFDAASPNRSPVINGYKAFSSSGRVYLMARAQDGDDATDQTLPNAFAAMQLTDAVEDPDNPDQDPEHIALREARVLTFYVNHSPYFNFENTNFFPRPPEFNGGVVASSPDRKLVLNLLATDPDPFDQATRPPTGGGPSTSTVLRTQVKVIGKNAQGSDTSYIAPRSFTTAQTIDLAAEAPYITGTDLLLDIELCDCPNPEAQAGTGRCIRTRPPIPVTVPPVAASSSVRAPDGVPRVGTNTTHTTHTTNGPGRSITP